MEVEDISKRSDDLAKDEEESLVSMKPPETRYGTGNDIEKSKSENLMLKVPRLADDRTKEVDELDKSVTIREMVQSDTLDKSPPDFSLARVHGDAQRVKNLDQCEYKKEKLENPKLFCPCCQMPTTQSAPLYPLCTRIYELEDFGCGFPLYFYFKIFIFISYFIMVCLVSISGWVIYSNSKRGHEWMDDGESVPFIIPLSIGNLGKHEDNYTTDDANIVIVLNTVTILILFLLSIIFKQIQIQVVRKIDEINVSPGDFTIMVSNIPREKSKEEIKEWLNNHGEGEICDVNLCYDLKESIEKIAKVTKLKKILVNFDQMASDPGIKKTYDENMIKTEIQKLEKDINHIKEKMQKDDADKNFTGKAFVIYNKQSDAEKQVWLFKRSWVRKLLNFILIKIFRMEKSIDDRWWEGKRVDIERAAEPTNVFWENMAVKAKHRIFNGFKTYGIAFLGLCVVFVINLALSFAREELDDEVSKDKEVDAGVYATLLAISFISSMIIATNNTILSKVVRYLSKFERHETYTKFNLTVSIKLTVCMFINTGIIPLIVNFGKDRWFGRSGLAMDMFFIMLAINFVTPTLSLLNPFHFWKLFRFKWEEWKGVKSKMTQREANKLREGVECNLPFYHATTMLTFSITCFYAPLIPMLPIISFVGIIYKFSVEWYIILRRCKLPQEMAEQMGLTFTDLIPVSLFFYALGQFIFVSELSENENFLPHIALWGSFLLMLFPFRSCFKRCEGDISRDDDETYLKNKSKFLNDYDRSNPVTSKEATLQHLENMQGEQRYDGNLRFNKLFQQKLQAKL